MEHVAHRSVQWCLCSANLCINVAVYDSVSLVQRGTRIVYNTTTPMPSDNQDGGLFESRVEAVAHVNGNQTPVDLLTKRFNWIGYTTEKQKLAGTCQVVTNIALDAEYQSMMHKDQGNMENIHGENGIIDIRWTYDEIVRHACINQECPEDGPPPDNVTVEFLGFDGIVKDMGGHGSLSMSILTDKAASGPAKEEKDQGKEVDANKCQDGLCRVDSRCDKCQCITTHATYSIVTAGTSTGIITTVEKQTHEVVATKAGFEIPMIQCIPSGETPYFFEHDPHVVSMKSGGDNEETPPDSLKWICVKLGQNGTTLVRFDAVILSHFKDLWDVATNAYPWMLDDSGELSKGYASIVHVKDGEQMCTYARVPYVRHKSVATLVNGTGTVIGGSTDHAFGPGDQLILRLTDRCHAIRKKINRQKLAGQKGIQSMQSVFDIAHCSPLLTLKVCVRWRETRRTLHNYLFEKPPQPNMKAGA